MTRKRKAPPPRQLLRDAIAKSGLSARQYAMQVLIRDERTVRRWLAGEKMPRSVIEFLHKATP